MNKKEEFQILERKTRFIGKPETLIASLKKNKRSFYVRETSYMVSIIYDNREVSYQKKNEQFPLNQLWLFRSVKADALRMAKEVEEGKKTFVMPEKIPVNRTNLDYDDSYGTLTGTDINSAYWTIAKNIGVISEKTYTRAYAEDTKVTRLAALSTLGRNLAYQQYVDGSVVKDRRVIEGEKILQEFYKAIRYTCYHHMATLAEMLGKDFDAYRTDCIYYRDSEENRNMVYEYLDQFGFYYKQLEFEEQQ